jgi:hypothetical protein
MLAVRPACAMNACCCPGGWFQLRIPKRKSSNVVRSVSGDPYHHAILEPDDSRDTHPQKSNVSLDASLGCTHIAFDVRETISVGNITNMPYRFLSGGHSTAKPNPYPRAPNTFIASWAVPMQFVLILTNVALVAVSIKCTRHSSIPVQSLTVQRRRPRNPNDCRLECL